MPDFTPLFYFNHSWGSGMLALTAIACVLHMGNIGHARCSIGLWAENIASIFSNHHLYVFILHIYILCVYVL